MSRVFPASCIACSILLGAAGLAMAQSPEPPPTAEPVLTAPASPKHGGKSDTGPVQIQALGKPDLALIGVFTLGNADIPWGTSAVLSADVSSFREKGECRFRYRYLTRNQGLVAAAAANNSVFRDAQNGPVLASVGLPALAKGAQAASSGHIALKPGIWMLYVHADATKLVPESDEANNLRRIKVTVQGDCR